MDNLFNFGYIAVNHGDGLPPQEVVGSIARNDVFSSLLREKVISILRDGPGMRGCRCSLLRSHDGVDFTIYGTKKAQQVELNNTPA